MSALDRRQIKRATELLVDELGGIEKAGLLVGKGKTSVARWYDTRNADNAAYSAPVCDVREMEANAGDCHVTKALCRLNGGVFVRLPRAIGDDALTTQVLLLTKELGDVSAAIAEGLADGELDDGERARALDQLHELDTASAKLRLMLAVPVPPGANGEAG